MRERNHHRILLREESIHRESFFGEVVIWQRLVEQFFQTFFYSSAFSVYSQMFLIPFNIFQSPFICFYLSIGL